MNVKQQPEPEEELVTCLGCNEQIKKSRAREVGVEKYFCKEKCFVVFITKEENRPSLAW